jgi:anaerobic selenocysteine-containing dehydrogenase
MLCVLIDADLVDKEFIARHTDGFSALQKTVKKYQPRVAEKIYDVAECLIVEAALIFGMAQSALSLWSMGVNQSIVGVQKNNVITIFTWPREK